MTGLSLAHGRPRGLTESPSDDATRLHAWSVVHTKSRQEKALAEVLDGRGVSYFLPCARHVRYYGRRKFVVTAPLFPGYLFLRGGMEDRYFAERTDRVVRVIGVVDQRGLEADLNALRFALERDGELRPTSFIQEGIEVEVRAGPFRGLRGIVDRWAVGDRVVLRARALAKAAELEIDRTLLEPVN